MAMAAPHAGRHNHFFSTADEAGMPLIGETFEPLDQFLAERHQELAADLYPSPLAAQSPVVKLATRP